MNPMYYYLSLAREMVIYGNVPSFGIFAGAVFFSIFFIMIGFFVFKQLKIKFAEMV